MGGVRSDQADSSKIGEQTRQRWKFTWAMAWCWIILIDFTWQVRILLLYLSRLRMLAELDNLSVLTVSRLPLRYFHFASFTDCFEDFTMDDSNCWMF